MSNQTDLPPKPRDFARITTVDSNPPHPEDRAFKFLMGEVNVLGLLYFVVTAGGVGLAIIGVIVVVAIAFEMLTGKELE